MGTNKLNSGAVKRPSTVRQKVSREVDINDLDKKITSKPSVESRTKSAKGTASLPKRKAVQQDEDHDPLDNPELTADDDDDDFINRPSLLQDNNLPHIPARPGYVQRWVRYETRFGVVDKGNIRKMMSKDWRPRQGTNVSKKYNLAPETDPNFGNVIIVQGNILCERTVEKANKWKKLWRDKTRRNEQAVTQDVNKDLTERERSLRVNPTYESRSSVTRKAVRVAPDEEEIDS